MVSTRSYLDRDFKFLAKNYPQDFAKLVLNTRDEFSIHSYDQELNVPQLRTDNLYIVERNKKKFALHIEFQLRHKPQVPERMFLYNALFQSALKLPTLSAIFYLERRNYRKLPKSYTKHWDDIGHSFTYPVVCLWDHLERIRNGELPGLVSILMLLTKEKTIDIFAESKALIKKVEPDPEKQVEQLSIAAALAGRYELPAERIMEILKEEYEMLKEKNTFFELLRNEGKQEGEQEGLKKGEQKGLQEGKQDSIVEVLQERFGSLDPGIRVQVKQIRDDQTLKELLHSSIRAKKIDDFKKTLSQSQSKGFSG